MSWGTWACGELGGCPPSEARRALPPPLRGASKMAPSGRPPARSGLPLPGPRLALPALGAGVSSGARLRPWPREDDGVAAPALREAVRVRRAGEVRGASLSVPARRGVWGEPDPPGRDPSSAGGPRRLPEAVAPPRRKAAKRPSSGPRWARGGAVAAASEASVLKSRAVATLTLSHGPLCKRLPWQRSIAAIT